MADNLREFLYLHFAVESIVIFYEQRRSNFRNCWRHFFDRQVRRGGLQIAIFSIFYSAFWGSNVTCCCCCCDCYWVVGEISFVVVSCDGFCVVAKASFKVVVAVSGCVVGKTSYSVVFVVCDCVVSNVSWVNHSCLFHVFTWTDFSFNKKLND